MSEHDLGNRIADPELLAGFLDETRDQLDLVGDQLVQLENHPGNKTIIESIFRAAHSIKGNSSFFGFMTAKQLAHRLENLLDAMRKDKLAADRDVISCLLTGLDHLGSIFERICTSGEESTDPAVFDAIIETIQVQEQRAGGAPGESTDWASINGDILAAEEALCRLPVTEHPAVQKVIAHLRALDPGKANRVEALPSKGILGELNDILAPPMDGVLDPDQSSQVLVLLEQVLAAAGDDYARNLALEMIDGYRTFTEAMGFDPLLREFLQERLLKIPGMQGFASLMTAPADELPHVSVETSTPLAKGKPISEEEIAASAQAANQGDKSMRVSEARVDTFLHYVGELLVVGDMFDHLQGRARGLSAGGHPSLHLLARDLRRATETFADLSSKLQSSIMGIRKIPIRRLLQKVPRIVRDASQAKGKEATVVIEDDDIDIDKSLVDLMDAPLTHMARNAADHGIEKPEEREKCGKPRVGNIHVRATETSTSIVLSIEDDGGGLDLERIRAKAESLGLVKPETAMSEDDVVNCIFASGLSTAESITDISGRGVGMDVVKRAIDDAGGTIQVHTVRGKGSSFVLTLPKRVTTQILPGYLMRLRDQLFVVPLERVRETFRIDTEEVSSMGSHGRCLMRHGEILRFLALADALDLSPMDSVLRATAVTLESKGKRLAIEVDQVIGVQKVVVCSIRGLPATNRLLGGGALMGDGSVAMILNVDALVEY
jgi:two-component system chemotaxis sensor kinase CheA